MRTLTVRVRLQRLRRRVGLAYLVVAPRARAFLPRVRDRLLQPERRRDRLFRQRLADLVAKIPVWRVVLDLTFGSLCLRARGRAPRIALARGRAASRPTQAASDAALQKLSDGRAEHAAGSTP